VKIKVLTAMVKGCVKPGESISIPLQVLSSFYALKKMKEAKERN
jgi:hypothetical protein